MNETRFDERVQNLAAALAYPPTPDVAGRVGARMSAGARRQPRWVILAGVFAALIFCLALSAVPEARALLLRVWQIGVVQIIAPEPSPAPRTSTQTPLPATASATPRPATNPIQDALFPFKGKTTLDAARRDVPFAVLLPQVPADLGQPDLVFLQRQFNEADVLVLIWFEPGDNSRTRMSLHMLTKNVQARKLAPRVIEQTTVSGQPAVWAAGEYVFVLRNGSLDVRRVVDGNTLIWEHDGITYRLESRMTLDEARKVAESLR